MLGYKPRVVAGAANKSILNLTSGKRYCMRPATYGGWVETEFNDVAARIRDRFPREVDLASCSPAVALRP